MTAHWISPVMVAAMLPVAAHGQAMPGMTMPIPAAKPKPAPPPRKRAPVPGPKQQAPAHAHAPAPRAPQAAASAPLAPPAVMEAMPGIDAPAPAAPPPAAPMDPMPPMAPMAPMAKPEAAIPGMDMSAVPLAYGEGSGTARLPGNEGAMHGLHFGSGAWMLMAHGYAWGVYTDQGGPRGKKQAFVESMAMLTATRDFGTRTQLQFRAMTSLEPAMGERGYPNLFATGETAYGQPLIDRQHPHDLFMELSAKLAVDLGGGAQAFVYGGPVAEPAIGPSAFMHRASGQYLALSPITHHWFDSTHITYGVVTGGLGTDHFQIETSAFRGREPDEHRWDIETPKLDSWSVRATWTPSPAWAIQASHGRLKSPETGHSGEDEARTTASVQYAAGPLSTTFGWSAKNRVPGPVLTAWLAEANYDLNAHHSVFGRFENVANDELFPSTADPLHDVKVRVSRFEAGYAYRLRLVGPIGLALGGSLAAYAKPTALDAAYGKNPVSYTLFAKLMLGH